MLKRLPGTYALILRAQRNRSIRVGRLGPLAVKKGYYVYVGSAFGPGGLAARVERHRRHHKRLHWHVDYLRRAATPVGVWYSLDADRCEHRWARCLEALDTMALIRGFGSSDCRCAGHLFYTRRFPGWPRLKPILSPKARYELFFGKGRPPARD